MIIKRATKDGEAFFLDVEISTPALIEELEKRRPQCHYSTCKNMGSEVCGGCLWNTCMGDKLTDNFKPAK